MQVMYGDLPWSMNLAFVSKIPSVKFNWFVSFILNTAQLTFEPAIEY